MPARSKQLQVKGDPTHCKDLILETLALVNTHQSQKSHLKPTLPSCCERGQKSLCVFEALPQKDAIQRFQRKKPSMPLVNYQKNMCQSTFGISELFKKLRVRRGVVLVPCIVNYVFIGLSCHLLSYSYCFFNHSRFKPSIRNKLSYKTLLM